MPDAAPSLTVDIGAAIYFTNFPHLCSSSGKEKPMGGVERLSPDPEWRREAVWCEG